MSILHCFLECTEPLYQENLKLGQSDKKGKNDPVDINPKKVTKLNMKYGLVLYTAIYIYDI